MKRLLSGWLGCALAMGLVNPGPVQAQDVPVQWISGSVPHAVVANGDAISGGFMVETLNWFTDRLPGYRHELRHYPWKRVHALLSTPGEELHCGFALLKNRDRAARYYVSRPVQWAMGFRLGYLQGNERVENAISPRGEFILEKFSKGTGVAGNILGRVYGAGIDGLYRQLDEMKRLTLVSEDARLMDMLMRKRVDILIDYPSMFQGRPEIRLLKIQGMDAYNSIHFACRRTNAGQELIRRVDALIGEQPSLPPYAAFLLRKMPAPFAKELKQQFVGAGMEESGEAGANGS